MKYKFANKPERCPECGSDKIADILYGLPDFSVGLQNELESGRIALGGCCVTGNDPAWQCNSCNTLIYRIKIDLTNPAN